MQEDARWSLIADPDRELKGGVILSEWCALIVQDTDLAFASGANLATIITATAGIETYLRSEYGAGERETLHKLIDGSPIREDLKAELHRIRKYRNRWVHVSDPSEDKDLIVNFEKYDRELEDMAIAAVRALRRTIYENQWT
ncbi:MAG TPA: hypothetical protein VEZ16_10635 [Microvirga sp.]|nr:hypothetical protein [Microvirga sp.]